MSAYLVLCSWTCVALCWVPIYRTLNREKLSLANVSTSAGRTVTRFLTIGGTGCSVLVFLLLAQFTGDAPPRLMVRVATEALTCGLSIVVFRHVVLTLGWVVQAFFLRHDRGRSDLLSRLVEQNERQVADFPTRRRIVLLCAVLLTVIFAVRCLRPGTLL